MSQPGGGGSQGHVPPNCMSGDAIGPAFLHFSACFFLQKINVLSYLANEVSEIRGEIEIGEGVLEK